MQFFYIPHFLPPPTDYPKRTFIVNSISRLHCAPSLRSTENGCEIFKVTYKLKRTMQKLQRQLPLGYFLAATLATPFVTAQASEQCSNWPATHQELLSTTSNWEVRLQSADGDAPTFVRKNGGLVTVEDERGQRNLTWKDAKEGLHLKSLLFYFPAGPLKCSMPLGEASQTQGDFSINIKKATAQTFQSTLTLKGQVVGSATLTLQVDREPVAP